MHLRRTRGLLAVAAVAIIAALAPAAASGTHNAAKPVHPGVMTFTDGAQCTSNFIFSDAGGTYIGQAAHCSGTGGATETNGCDSGSLPIGTPVKVDGASQPGTLAYNSWITMQQVNENNANACEYNDFALVRLNSADVPKVDPSVPFFGGPTGVGPSSAMLGDTVYSYGNSSLRGGVTQLSPKQGTVVASEGDGWSRTVYTATPGIPGDSGSGFVSDTGEAIGVLATLQILPTAGSNGVGDLRHELDYMRANSAFSGVQLVPGTEPFNPNLAGAILASLGG
jgi:Trypsin-like peptidase domain